MKSRACPAGENASTPAKTVALNEILAIAFKVIFASLVNQSGARPRTPLAKLRPLPVHQRLECTLLIRHDRGRDRGRERTERAFCGIERAGLGVAEGRDVLLDQLLALRRGFLRHDEARVLELDQRGLERAP